MMNRSPVAILYDASGNPIAVQDGVAIPASTPLIMVGGTDGTNAQYLSVDSAGRLIVKQQEKATFVAQAAGAASTTSGKSMVSLLNASGSSVIVNLHEVHITNVQFSSLTGQMLGFQLRRFTNHSAGTSLTPQTFDTANSLNGSVTARTGATLTGESSTSLWQWYFSSDEFGPGTLDQEGSQATISNFNAAWKKQAPLSAIVLRAGEGISLRLNSSTGAFVGTFDCRFVFTQE